MSAPTKGRNSSIDLLKFLFSIVIVLFHFGTRQGINLLPGGYLVVEGFFMITGYFMMNSANKATSTDIGKDSLKFVLHKYSSFALPLLFSAIIAFCAPLAFKPFYPSRFLTDCVTLLSEIVPLQITGMKTLASTGVSWYLSAMLFALMILYPLARMTGSRFTRIICPILIFLIYGAICSEFGHLNVITDLFYGMPIRVGLLRGIAGICSGCILYDCVKSAENQKVSRFGEICFLFAEIFSAAFIMLVICVFPKTAMDYFALPFFFILLYSLFGRKSSFSGRFSFGFTKHLGTASLLIYLNHHYWNYFFNFHMDKIFVITSTAIKFAIYIVMIACSCVVVQAATLLTKHLWKKFRPFLKKHFVGETDE